MPNRSAFEGIVYVLKTGIPWRMLPEEFGCSGVTCWRRLRDWREADVWRRLWCVLLDRLGRSGLIDRSRASVDSASVAAKKGEKTEPNPVDSGRPGSKRHLLLDRDGVPLAVVLTGANVHDPEVFEELVDGAEPVRGPRGRPRKRPDKLHADKGYDYQRCRRFLRSRRMRARIARHGIESSERLALPRDRGANLRLAILLPKADGPLRT